MHVRLNDGDSADPYQDWVTLSLTEESPYSNESANFPSTEERKVSWGDYLEESGKQVTHVEIPIRERERTVPLRIYEERRDEADLMVRPLGQRRHDSKSHGHLQE